MEVAVNEGDLQIIKINELLLVKKLMSVTLA